MEIPFIVGLINYLLIILGARCWWRR